MNKLPKINFSYQIANRAPLVRVGDQGGQPCAVGVWGHSPLEVEKILKLFSILEGFSALSSTFKDFKTSWKINNWV